MRTSEIYKTFVGFDDGGIAYCDAVEYDDVIWLVPKWIDVPEEHYRTPERMIRVDQFEHQMLPAPSAINIAVNEPVPHALFSGELTPVLKEKYAVYDKPDFRYREEGGG